MSTRMQDAAHVPLAEVTRGDEVESLHAGSIAVVDTGGRILYAAGDPECLTFTRSTIKPFQAAPFIAAGGAERFGLDARELALLCASHSGEEMHVQTVQSILQKADCQEQQLGCGCHVPMRYSLEALPPPGAVFTQLHHNCSGKHAGFLASCIQHGWPIADYLNPSHPLQLAVRRSVAHFAGMAEDELKMGIDGCSAPNYAMPLSRLALSYARLAQDGSDDVYGDAPAKLCAAMTASPELVSGTGRTDVAFMQSGPGDWVAKIGAEGVQVIGIRSAGLGIAVKVADGNTRALCTATVSVLQQLGLLAHPEASPLAAWVRPKTHNYAGIRTGELRAVFALAGRS